MWWTERVCKVGRKPKPRKISFKMIIERFIPEPVCNEGVVEISADEIEAMRLVDLNGLNYSKAGVKMNVSKSTIARLVKNARKKLIKGIVEGIEIHIKK